MPKFILKIKKGRKNKIRKFYSGKQKWDLANE